MGFPGTRVHGEGMLRVITLNYSYILITFILSINYRYNFNLTTTGINYTFSL